MILENLTVILDILANNSDFPVEQLLKSAKNIIGGEVFAFLMSYRDVIPPALLKRQRDTDQACAQRIQTEGTVNMSDSRESGKQ